MSNGAAGRRSALRHGVCRAAAAGAGAALLLLWVPLPAGAAAEVPPPAADLRIRHESRLVTSAGVTEQRSFEERLLRRDGVVWRERVLPAAVAGRSHGHAHAGGREHFDYDAAALWLHCAPGQPPDLRFVDLRSRVVVAVPAAEYETVGFDGSCAAAASLVDPQRVARMPLSPRPSPVRGAAWHEEAHNGWYRRVLWHEVRQLALVVESGRDDNTQYSRSTAEEMPATPDPQLPWREAPRYEQKRYDDFMD